MGFQWAAIWSDSDNSRRISASSSACRMWFFTTTVVARRRRGKWNYNKLNKTKRSILTEIQLFFLNKHSMDCCKTFVNFQISEKVVFKNWLPLFALLL